MNTTMNPQTTRSAIVALGLLAVAACGSRVEGRYVGNGPTFLESVELTSDGKANVTFMGMTKQGSYSVEGRQVVVTIGGDANVFTINDAGCLAGGGFLGDYCRE